MSINSQRPVISGQIGGLHISVLAVLLNKCQHFDRLYVFPTQKRLLSWVKAGSGIKRCRRTLNYVLLRLEGKGLIKRIQRHYNDRVLGHVFRSTLYSLTHKGLKRLKWLGVPAFEIAASITRGVKGRPKKRPPPGGSERQGEMMNDVKAVMTKILDGIKPI